MTNGRTPIEKFHDAEGTDAKLLIVLDEVLEVKLKFTEQLKICNKKFITRTQAIIAALVLVLLFAGVISPSIALKLIGL
jgi:hypothetical protein